MVTENLAQKHENSKNNPDTQSNDHNYENSEKLSPFQKIVLTPPKEALEPKSKVNQPAQFKLMASKIILQRIPSSQKTLYEKRITQLKNSISTIYLPSKIEDTPESEWTESGFNKRFLHFSELTITSIKLLVKFLSSIEDLKLLERSLLLQLCKNNIIYMIVFRCAMTYNLDTDRINTLSGNTLSKADYMSLGFPESVVSALFKSSKGGKKLIAHDRFLAACIKVILVLNVNKKDVTDEQFRKVVHTRNFYFKLLEYYCNSRNKPLLNIELLMYQGEYFVTAKKCIEWLIMLKSKGLETPFDVLDTLMSLYIEQNNDVYV